jgi:hypothetical protein
MGQLVPLHRGDVAAAAAEYVEACAWLVAALPPNALPGARIDWFVPDATATATANAAKVEGNACEATTAAVCRPTVGMRVRVLGADGSSRAGMVSYVVRGRVRGRGSNLYKQAPTNPTPLLNELHT